MWMMLPCSKACVGVSLNVQVIELLYIISVIIIFEPLRKGLGYLAPLAMMRQLYDVNLSLLVILGPYL